MLGGMATTKASGGKKQAAGKVARRKSKLTLAAEAAQRGMLLQALKDGGWNLTVCAEALDLSSPSDVLRAIKGLGLTDEYEAAKERGDVSPGSRRSKQDS